MSAGTGGEYVVDLDVENINESLADGCCRWRYFDSRASTM